MITAERLGFAYPDGTAVFKNFDLRIERGQAWAIIGPSGCGKTTLLYLIAGLLLPTEGELRLDNVLIRRPRPKTGLILQDYGLLPWATVYENIALGYQLRDFYGPDGKHAPADEQRVEIHARVQPWLERLGLDELSDQYPSQISGGQRQRTAIARTLSLRPDVVLMDEPFASLDAPTRESLQELLLNLREERDLTSIIVTHTIEEAAVLGRHILVLTDPPNHSTRVFDNPSGASASFRDTQAYLDLCRELRNELESGP